MTIQDYTQRLLAHMGVNDAQVELIENDQEWLVQISIADQSAVGMLIGHHGETLSAVQRLLRIIFQSDLETAGAKLHININDYRQQRVEKLETMMMTIAQRVVETQEPYTLPYLPANERFVIHSTLSEKPEFSALESISQGEGLGRRLTIRLKSTTQENSAMSS